MGAVKRHDWTPRKRSRVLALVDGGKHSIRQISRLLDIPKSTVSDIKQRGTPNSKPKSGRPAVLSSRDKRRINAYVRQCRATRQETPESIIKALNLPIGRTTLISVLHELGYRRYVARRRCLLKDIDYKRRLAFARKYRHFTVEDWKRVLFTDEMSIKIGMERMSIMWVWRKKGEKFHKDCVDQRKREGVGMMFWGAFRADKMGPGFFFDLKSGQKINSTVYRDQVLLGPLKQFRDQSVKDVANPIVMEDGAPVHKGACNGLREQMKWETYLHPPNSPDLNPIENIWAWMKQEISRKHKHITSKAEMQRIVLEMWNNFDDKKWNGLIASMPDRMKAVIKAKGGPTRY